MRGGERKGPLDQPEREGTSLQSPTREREHEREGASLQSLTRECEPVMETETATNMKICMY